MRGMREDLERLTERLTPRSMSANPAFNPTAFPGEANHRVPTPNDTLPDPMHGDSIAQLSTSELVSGGGLFSSEFAFDMSQASLPAKGLSTTASEAASGEDEGSNRRRLSRENGRIKSCTQCRLHKVLSRSLLAPK
jgi:hypothetical protein